MANEKRRRGWLRPSTRAFLDEAQRTPGFSLFDRLHGYVYARWPYLYIGAGTGGHVLGRLLKPLVNAVSAIVPQRDGGPTFADAYHGKVVPLSAATQLVTVNEDIRLTDLEPIVPYALARDIVLKNPDHIAVLECPCRAAQPVHCEPLDVCLVIGEPFASFIVEHHPQRARWITPQEAVDILRAEDERGHAHHAFFKDAMLGRFYAICNCCDCCCGAIQAHRNGTPMLASSGYVCQLDETLCVGCGACAERCPFGALSIEGGSAVVDAAACMGCGVCVAACAQEALQLVRDLARGEPLEIQRLMAVVG